ncbi:MAG: hypothetical protein ABIG61_00105 [Planctomycetota bacterium]
MPRTYKKLTFVLSLLILVAVMDIGFAESSNSRIICFPENSKVEVLVSEKEDFVGIGGIVVEGLQLSSSARPMKIEIAGRNDRYDVWHMPKPIAYKQQKLAGIETTKDSATLYVDLICADRSVDKLQIVFEFIQEKFYESEAVGMQYHFVWSSDNRYAHQVRESSWWTFGDSIDGLRYISQNAGYGRGSIDIVIREGMPFGGYKLAGVVETSDIGRIIKQKTENPVQFAYLPHVADNGARETRQGAGDYLTFFGRDEKNISFIRYAEEPTMNYWQFERVAGEKEICFEEWYCMPLEKSIRTVPIKSQILHKAGINAWIDAKEIVRAKLLKAAGLPDQNPLPWVAYTVRYVDPKDDNKYWIPNDKVLAMMKQAGIKEFWWYGPWQSNWTETDRMTPKEIEKHSPIYSHAVWDYDWGYKKYDVEGFRQLSIAARKEGIEPIIWATQTMSQCSPHIYAHPDWTLRRTDGSLFNYVYRDLVGMYHASGYSDYYVNRISSRMKEVSFNGIWLDSFFFSSDILNWMDPKLQPNFLAALDTVRKLWAIGMKRVYSEQHGPFMLSSATGYMDKTKKKAGQQLYLLYNTAVCDHLGNINTGLEYTAENYFMQLAFKSCPQPYIQHYFDNPEFVSLASYANKAYVKALPNMRKCVVLENNKGTLYFNESRNKAVVFSFIDGEIDVDKTISAAKEMMQGMPCVFVDTKLSVQRYKVYLLEVE